MPVVPDTLDALVIGGGPAGSTAARALAGLGWRTALIERGARHRTKACGDCLNARGVRLLRRAGLLEGVRAIAAGTTSGVRVHVAGRRPLSAPLPAGDDGGLLVPRDRFDQLLVDRAADAGVQVLQPATARVAELTPRGALVKVRAGGRSRAVRCRLLVGADGLRSAIAASAGLSRPRGAGHKFGFAMDVDDSPDAIRRGTIEMFVVEGGYLGLVARADGRLHVAGLVSSGAAASSPLAFVETVTRRFEALRCSGLGRLDRSRIRLVGAGPMPCRPAGVAAGPVALVGDAAGYAEPFSGEGISWALESAATLAAAAARVAPGDWTAATAGAYRRAWRRRVGRRQRLCRLLARTLERRGLTAALAGAAERCPAIAAWLVQRAATA